MKAKDIVVGEEYAVGKASWPSRVRVLEVGNLPRSVAAGANSWRRTTKVLPSVRVRKLNHDGTDFVPNQGYSTEDVLPLAKVLRTWTDQAKLVERNNLAAEREAEKYARLTGKADVIEAALAANGIKANVGVDGSMLRVGLWGEEAIDGFLRLLDPEGTSLH